MAKRVGSVVTYSRLRCPLPRGLVSPRPRDRIPCPHRTGGGRALGDVSGVERQGAALLPPPTELGAARDKVERLLLEAGLVKGVAEWTQAVGVSLQE
jgi:hypothetical protein